MGEGNVVLYCLIRAPMSSKINQKDTLDTNLLQYWYTWITSKK
jgi:hypothetical protein